MGHRASRAVALGISIVCALSATPSGVTAATHVAHRAAASAAPGNCPTVMAESAIHAGQKGTGWTVEQGQTREAFKVTILGVLPDGIGPGVDMIVIKVSDKPGSDMIKRAGGIWAGMSGSPVYIGGKLAGAVSYGFTSSPSPIGGLTPAEAMVGLLGYPPAAASSAPDGARQVQLPSRLAARVAKAAGVSEQTASTLSRLAMPLAVSGLDAASRTRLQARLDKAGMDVIVTPGNSVKAPSGTTTYDTPQAGGNFAGLLSYGDVTSGGVGTTTYVCGNQAIAFGHPLNFSGRVADGASNANAIGVIRDNVLGSFKMASIGAPFGRLDQDRLTGIRATLGEAPHLIPVTSDITAPSLNRHRVGETDITDSSLVSSFAPEHLYQNMLVTLDKEGSGSALVSWTVNGRRANGDPWTLSRTNRFASTRDIANTAADDLFQNLLSIDDNTFEDVRYTSVDITSTVSSVVHGLTIQDVLFSRNGGAFRHRTTLNVHPGDQLTVRVVMSKEGTTGTDTRDLSITIPTDALGPAGLIVAGGGNLSSPCGFDSACGTSFDDLLTILANAPHNNDLVAQLITFDADFNPVLSASDQKSLPSVVSGDLQFNVNIQ